MKENFEQRDEQKSRGGKEASAIILLIISILVFLVLLTKNLILGEFGAIMSNFVLGVFGFSSYAIFLAMIIGSIMSLFTNSNRKNTLTIFSLCLILLSGIIAIHLWTSSASQIYLSSLTFNEYLNNSYNLKSIGISGASCGGVIMSAILYYPVKFIKIGGVYTLAAIIFVGGGFGIYASIRKKYFGGMKKQPMQQNGQFNNYNYQNNNIPEMMQNANRVNFGARLSDLPYQQPSQTDFNGQNMFNRELYNNEVQPQQNYADARNILYPTNNNQNNPIAQNNYTTADNFDNENRLKGIGDKNKSGLYVFNPTKNNQLKEKSKKEIDKEEKQRSAYDLLFPDKSDGSDFTVNKYNKPKKLGENRSEYNPLNDNIRNDSVTDIFNSNFGKVNKIKFDKNDDSDKRVDFVNKPFEQIPDNLIHSESNDLLDKKNNEYSEQQNMTIESLYSTDDDKKEDKATKPNKSADPYRSIMPSKIPPILKVSDMKKKEEETKENTEEQNENILKNSDNANNLYTKEDYENNTREIKDLFASGKIKNREVDISAFNYTYDKSLPQDLSKIKIISSVNQIKKNNDTSKSIDDFSKDSLDTTIDEQMNKLGLSSNDQNQFIKSNNENTDDIIDSNVAYVPRYDADFVETDNENIIDENKKEPTTKTYMSFYPIKEPKIIKTASGENASQLPIYAANKTVVQLNKDTQTEGLTPINRKPYLCPPFEYLAKSDGVSEDNSAEIQEKSRKLEEILASFDIGAKVVATIKGPVVTRYELEIEAGTSVKRVELLSKDITMGLESPSEVFIQAPIPGKNRFGVEVPNKTRAKVAMREIVESDLFRKNKSPVVFALGKDVAGKMILCDIKRMPHLLVAGSTGMGKSVCLNSLLVSLLYHSSPEDVRIILVDPKRVEFNIYQGLPHLLINEIINDSEKAISAFDWAISEMERRFNLFQMTKTRDIDSYNDSLDLTTHKKLARIIIIVDEVSDLMSYNKKDLEMRIIRLAQKARAAGIHLVLATQRPSVDVITGVIKTNLPSRISFKLSNGIDSKTVLDETGAEKLLGYGDMFYKPVDLADKMRVQGCFVDTPEVDKIVSFVINNNPAEFDEEVKNIINAPKKENNDNIEVSFAQKENDIMHDDIFKEAVKLAIENNQISISMLQRRYPVGYARAGKMIDAMEKMGYVSSFNGSKPREVYVTKDQFEKDFGEPY